MLASFAACYLIKRPSLALRQRLAEKWFGSEPRPAASSVPLIKLKQRANSPVVRRSRRQPSDCARLLT